MRKKLILGLVFSLVVLGLGSQSISDSYAAVDSAGKEFMITYLPNLSTGTNYASQLHITSDVATSVSVKYPANSPTFIANVNTTPGQITIVDLPQTVWRGWSAGSIQNNSVWVESDEEITVYTTNLRRAASDAALAIPSDANSFKYIISTWTGSTKQFAISAFSDNTAVTITPKNSLSGGFSAGIPFDLTLNRGEGFLGQSNSDLTGSIITSDKPISMTYGNLCTSIPPGGACDHIYEHGIPVQGWGTSAIVGDIPLRDGSRYVVVASEDNTQISLDGSNVATLDEGQFYRTGFIGGSHHISADKPIFTTQFMTGGGQTTGDPAMTSIIPPEQFLPKYTFSTIGGNQFTNGHFVAITIASSDVNSVVLDGSSVDSSIFSSVGSTGFSYGVVFPLDEGAHTISSPNGLGIQVGGFGFFDSYFYPGGAAFEFINPQPEDDRDGDGVFDINDECPDEFAQTDNGCPLQCEEPEQISVFYDFNDGVPEEFSGVTTTESVQGFSNYGFDGDFLRNTSVLQSPTALNSTITLESLPPHDSIDITFLLAIIDSWDSDDGSCCSPDIFNVSVDGQVVFNSTHNNAIGTNDYSNENPESVLVYKQHIDWWNSYPESAYDLSNESKLKGIPHSSDTLTIDFYASGAGWQGGNDESWGIDNLQITTNLSQPLCEVPEPKEDDGDGGMNSWDTRPTFGISHEDRQNQVVENGFSFNGDYFTVTDNHHTDFAEQSVEIGTMNSFSATVYADKKLKVQEFLFGIPNVGEAHLAELGIEVWYDLDGNIEDVVVVQKSEVIDADTVSVSHEKTKCLSTDPEPLCDTTTVSMTFLEPLADKVMAIKAIDHARRDQRTFLNDGFDISGESLNPMLTKMIPSNLKNQGLLKVTQLAKYSPYWQSEDGRMFEMNSFGSFKEVNQTFERFQDTGDARTRMHSGFGGILDYEQNRATAMFDASKYNSQLPESFAYIFPETGERLSDEIIQEMLMQQEIAKEILKEMDKQNRHY